MSKTIDERVISMRIDNDQFEQGVDQTTRSLKKLDDSLKFNNSGGKDYFEQLHTSATKLNKVSFDGLLGSIKGIGSAVMDSMKNFGVFNIGRQLEQMVESSVKALTIQGPMQGWSAYETSIESAAKIVNATGMELDEVSPKLEKLRWFSDETSYSFESMSNTLGDFLANGTDLDQSVNAMMGIANAAGYSGVNAEKATHAMQGFSKAIGRGYMDRMNWSWIRTAGMNTKDFKEHLLEAAVEAKTLTKTADGLYKTIGKGTEVTAETFEANLSEQWLSRDAILRALETYGETADKIYDEYQKFGGNKETREIVREFGELAEYEDEIGLKAFRASQETKTLKDSVEALKTAVRSKWGKTWEIIFGNYDEARAFWSDFVEDMWGVFVTPNDVRNDILGFWKEFEGRTAFVNSLKNIWAGLMGIVQKIRQPFAEIFGWDDKRYTEKMGRFLADLTKDFEQVTLSFRNAFAPLDELEDEIEDVAKAAADLAEPVLASAEALDELAKAVIRGDYGNGAERIEKLGQNFKIVQNRVNELLGCSFRYADATDLVVDGSESAAEATEDLGEEAEEAAHRIDQYADVLFGLQKAAQIAVMAINAVGSFLLILANYVGRIVAYAFNKFIDVLAAMGRYLRKVTDNAAKGKNVIEQFADEIRTARENIEDFGEKAAKVMSNFFDNDFLPWVADAFKYVYNGLINNIWPALKETAGFIKEFLHYLVRGTGIPMLWNSLKNLATVVGTTLFNAVTKLFDKIKEIFGLLTKKGDSTDVTRSMEDNRSMAEKLADAVNGLFEGISKLIDFIANHIGSVGEFFGLFGGKNLDNVVAFTGAVNNTIGDASSISRGIADTGKSLKGVSEFIGNVSTYKTKWGSWIDGLSQLGADNLTTDKFVAFIQSLARIGVGGLMLKMGIGMSQAAKGVGDLAGALSKGAISTLNNFGGMLKAYENKVNAASLLTVAKAIGIITLSLVALSFVPTDALTNAGAVLAEVLLVLALIVKFYTAFKKMGTTITNDSHNVDVNNVVTVVSDTVLNPLGVAITNFGKTVAAGIKEAFRLPGLAVLLLSFAVSITMVFSVIKKILDLFKEYSDEELTQAFHVLVGIALVLVASMLVLCSLIGQYTKATINFNANAEKLKEKGSKMSEKKNGFNSFFEGQTKNFLGAAVAMVAMAYAVKLLLESAQEIIKINREGTMQELGLAILELVMLMVGLGAAVALAGSGGVIGLISFAATLYALAKVLPEIIPSLVAFEGIKVGSIAKVLAIFIVLEAAIAGFAFIMSKLKLDLGQVMKLGLAMVMIGASMLIFSNPSVLEGVKNFFLAAMTLAAALGILVVIDALSSGGLVRVLAVMSTTFIDIGLGAILFAGGLLILNIALQKFGEMLPILGNGITQFAEAVKGNWLTVILIFGALALAIYGLSKAGKILEPLFEIVKTFFGGIANFFKGSGDAAEEGEKKTSGFLNKIPNLIANALKVLGVVTLLAAPGVVDYLVKLLVSIINAFAAAITANGAQILDALWNVVKALLGLILQAIVKLLDGIGGFIGELLGKGGSWHSWLSNLIPAPKAEDSPIWGWFKGLFPKKGDLEESADESMEELGSQAERIKAATNGQGFFSLFKGDSSGIQTNHTTGLLKSKVEIKKPATQFVENTAEAIEEAAEDVAPEVASNTGNTFTDYFKDWCSQNGFSGEDLFSDISSENFDLSSVGADGIMSMVNGFTTEESILAATNGVDTVTDAMVDEGGVRVQDFETVATVQGTAYANQFLQSRTQAGNAARAVCKEMITIIEQQYDSFYNSGNAAGLRVMDGLIDGIDEKMEEAVRKIDELATKINEAMEKAEDMHSPSKVWESFGRFIIMGLANGLTKYAYIATDAVSNLSTSLGTVGDALNGDLESAPTIRPVLDFTDVTTGSKQISTMFDAERVNLTAQAMELNNQGTQMDQLLNIATKMYRELQNGQDLYLDDNILAGRINRRLGMV